MTIQLSLFSMPDMVKQNYPALLVSKVHMSFETWIARNHEFTVPNLNVDLDSHLRSIYLLQCWEDEYKWKEWYNRVDETNKK